MLIPLTLFWRPYLLFLVICASLISCIATFILPHESQRGITFILVILSVLFAFLWCWPEKQEKDLPETDFFHPSFLFIGSYIIYFLFSGALVSFFHGYRSDLVDLGQTPELTVNKVFILGFLSVAAFGMGMRTKVLFPGYKIKEILYSPDILRKKEAKYVISIFLIFGGSFMLYHLSLLGPLSFDLLRYLSPSAQGDLEFVWNNVFTMFESMLAWGALLSLFVFFMTQRVNRSGFWWIKWLMFIIIFLFVGVLAYTLSGKRSAVIPLLLFPIIWRHYLIKRLKFLYIVIFSSAIVAVIAFLLMVRIIVPLVEQDINIAKHVGEASGDVVEFYLNTPELATFDMVVATYTQREVLLREMGGPFWAFLKYNFGTMWLAFVPPGVWADKPPYEDPGHKYYQLLTGGNDNVGLAVTVWGTSFLFLHIPGILIGMFFLGWFFKGIYKLFCPLNGNPIDVFFYSIFIWIAFQFLRFGTLGFTFIYFVTYMLTGIIAVLYLSRKKPFIHDSSLSAY